MTDTCDVTPKLDSPSQRFCRVVAPFMTQFKGLMSYTIPKIDGAGEFHDPEPARREPGGEPGRANRHVAQTLGRPLSGSASQRDGQPDRTADALR